MSAVRFPRAGYSKAAGSARLLPGGDWVVAWGNTPWVTELTRTGRLLLGIDFIGRKGSYRAIPVMPGQLTRRSLRRAMDREPESWGGVGRYHSATLWRKWRCFIARSPWVWLRNEHLPDEPLVASTRCPASHRRAK